ncbi:hypothetical protein GCM10022384_46450 [Streptomyces marokkonensis]|uniref:Uncharacterized protein n=1 Tax=Streptomyces marokkonensis TaxID=324855 RepID=A0ABP7R8P1_9ACTN
MTITRVTHRHGRARDRGQVAGRAHAEHRRDGRLFGSIGAWHLRVTHRSGLAGARPVSSNLELVR